MIEFTFQIVRKIEIFNKKMLVQFIIHFEKSKARFTIPFLIPKMFSEFLNM